MLGLFIEQPVDAVIFRVRAGWHVFEPGMLRIVVEAVIVVVIFLNPTIADHVAGNGTADQQENQGDVNEGPEPHGMPKFEGQR